MPGSSVLRISSLVQLGVAPTGIYIVGIQRRLVVSLIHIANLTGGAVTVTLYVLPAATAPAPQYAILYGFSVPANDFIELFEGGILLDGWSFNGLASAPNAINVMVSGLES